MDKICKNCELWRKKDGSAYEGRCHLKPPEYVRIGPAMYEWQRPTTNDGDFCGEFQPRKESK